ncbi:MAG: hypothetical protein WBL66_02570 [Candidatus Acidiferrales bacterium]
METLEIKGYAGHPIHSLCNWEKYAMPLNRKSKHWKEARSAFELARLWTGNGEPAVPTVLAELLNSHDATRGTVIRSGITEHETQLPPRIHGPRCHDLALFGEQGQSAVTICVEAKADEPFGATVADELRNSAKRPVTAFPQRLDWLTRSLLGLAAFKGESHNIVSDQIRDLPYQLLTAMAGTLLEAENQHSAKAILVIHEFRTPKTADEKMERNAIELNRFLRLLLQQNGAVDANFQLRCGQLIGPLPLLERSVAKLRKMPYQIPLFVGKIRTACVA